MRYSARLALSLWCSRRTVPSLQSDDDVPQMPKGFVADAKRKL